MDFYVKLINGALEYAPTNFKTPGGGVIVNFNRNVRLMTTYGYKILEDIRPSYDTNTEYLQISEYLESENKITVVYSKHLISDLGNEPTLEGRITDLEKMDVDLIATTWDMDFRICEVEWFLEDSVPQISGASVAVKNIKNIKEIRNMALSRFEQAKIMILGDAYNRETLERQLTRYLQKGEIKQEEYDILILISMMDAKELVTEKI